MKAGSILTLFLSLAMLTGCGDDDNDMTATVDLQLVSARVGTVNLNAQNITENVPRDQPILLRFNLPLDTGDVIENVTLKDENETPLLLNMSFLDENSTISAKPDNNLASNTSYTLTIGPLSASTGEAFPGFTYRFSTETGLLNLRAVSISGQDLLASSRARDLPVNFTVEATFSQPLPDGTDFNDYISIGTLELDFALSEDRQTLAIQPLEDAAYLNRYFLNISEGLSSENGFVFQGFNQPFYTQLDSTFKFPEITDDALLTKIQEQTFRYFWDFAHPVSGMARERNTSGETVTTGGSGFGVMAIIAGIERGFITRDEGVERWAKIVNFLEAADRFHGVWPHWMNGTSGETIPFSPNDDGADLVETAFMIQGLLTVRQYLNPLIASEAVIIDKINQLWEAVEWDWFTRGGQNVLYWHWSPNFGWEKNLAISGWNESLIVYVLAASSPTHSISKEVYDAGWARNGQMQNGMQYNDITLPLGPDMGGPLFFAHYSFLGLDPRNLKDQYAGYWEQNINHALINRAYCINNPLDYVGYGETAWGLTASDSHNGYAAHSPTNDLGVITPTAALSSMPYTPDESLAAIRHFYYLMGDRLWGEYGFYDAYNVTENWYADSYLAIDQGPIIIMIENHRSGLFWDLFMSLPEIQAGLTKLDFTF